MVEMLMHFIEENGTLWKSCVNCAQSVQLLKREIQKTNIIRGKTESFGNRQTEAAKLAQHLVIVYPRYGSEIKSGATKTTLISSIAFVKEKIFETKEISNNGVLVETTLKVNMELILKNEQFQATGLIAAGLPAKKRPMVITRRLNKLFWKGISIVRKIWRAHRRTNFKKKLNYLIKQGTILLRQ
ncbi:hypothetical protein QLX08_004363 [Tetragonisca angustula]|uniref:Uncharacterized protein n=1 Tax=Tetragonisca angustula TaxID=166442 RepID=A0AAW1A2V0_9HYME